MCCCAWSPDGEWVAAGGQDDLVALYSLRERAVVAWGGGHASWVSAVAFDPQCAPPPLHSPDSPHHSN